MLLSGPNLWARHLQVHVCDLAHASGARDTSKTRVHVHVLSEHYSLAAQPPQHPHSSC